MPPYNFTRYLELIRLQLAKFNIPPHSFTTQEAQAAYDEGVDPQSAAQGFRDHHLENLLEEHYV